MNVHEFATEIYNASKRQKLDNSERLVELSEELEECDTPELFYEFLVHFLPESYSIPWNIVYKFAKVSKDAIPLFSKLKRDDSYWKYRVEVEYPDYAKFANVPRYVDEFRKRMPIPMDVSNWYLMYQAGRKRDYAILTKSYDVEFLGRLESEELSIDFVDFVKCVDAGSYLITTNRKLIALTNDNHSTVKNSNKYSRRFNYSFNDGFVRWGNQKVDVYPSSLVSTYNPMFFDWLMMIDPPSNIMKWGLSSTHGFIRSKNPRHIVSCREFLNALYRCWTENRLEIIDDVYERRIGLYDGGSELKMPVNSFYHCAKEGYCYITPNGDVYASEYNSDTPAQLIFNQPLPQFPGSRRSIPYVLLKHGTRFGIFDNLCLNANPSRIHIDGRIYVVDFPIIRGVTFKNGWLKLSRELLLDSDGWPIVSYTTIMIHLASFIENRKPSWIDVPSSLKRISMVADVGLELHFGTEGSDFFSTLWAMRFKDKTLLAAHCVHCNEPAEMGCIKCKTPYCDDVCQKLHWKEHKSVCK